jgi:hypothetical protein
MHVLPYPQLVVDQLYSISGWDISDMETDFGSDTPNFQISNTAFHFEWRSALTLILTGGNLGFDCAT